MSETLIREFEGVREGEIFYVGHKKWLEDEQGISPVDVSNPVIQLIISINK